MKLLRKWINKGNKIILTIDMNEYILEGDLAVKLKELGLIKAISY